MRAVQVKLRTWLLAVVKEQSTPCSSKNLISFINANCYIPIQLPSHQAPSRSGQVLRLTREREFAALSAFPGEIMANSRVLIDQQPASTSVASGICIEIRLGRALT
ncbi:hypothetical protein LCI18_009462 [Fusarium solani-melongenae]|uniref:Uncharacterized protein n=1 Tax=Fusarium solani subsp. cucurbitae TaxID=2747967 RepID=A0ACD3ZBR2_FUSSC|nr:hypothetical protein LCI18_009462 [Fusarium solani-melongenae]